MDRNAIRNEIVRQIMAQLDDGQIPWRKPWIGHGGMPQNVQTGHYYSGMNAVLLMWLGHSHWAGYGQWQKIGGQVNKGEKGTAIFIPMFKTMDKGSSNERSRLIGFKVSKIFNASQQTGWTAPKVETDGTALTPNEKADAIISNMQNRPTIVHEAGDKACYSPSLDKVTMPERDQFKTPEGYYSTMFHELSHSTGHASRNDRKGMGNMSTHEYSREELVAEFSAMFLNAECEIAPAVLKDAAAYIKGWKSRLTDTPEMIDGVLADAQKSANYVLNVKARDKATSKAS